MPKNIHTPRDELICGKLDRMMDIARDYNSCDMAELIHLIRHDAERMEQKLISRKQEAETRPTVTPSDTAMEDAVTREDTVRISDRQKLTSSTTDGDAERALEPDKLFKILICAYEQLLFENDNQPISKAERLDLRCFFDFMLEKGYLK